MSDGDDGTGKSIALSHVIHLCAQLKWLVLHVPSGKIISEYLTKDDSLCCYEGGLFHQSNNIQII